MKKLIDSTGLKSKIIFIGSEQDCVDFRNANFASNVFDKVVIEDASESDVLGEIAVSIPDTINDSAEKEATKETEKEVLFSVEVIAGIDGGAVINCLNKDGEKSSTTFSKDECEIFEKIVSNIMANLM